MSSVNDEPVRHIDKTSPENTPVHTNESTIDEILKSTHFLSIESQDINEAYRFYLNYLIQYDLYEVLKAEDRDNLLPWEDFVSVLRHCKNIRERAATVATKTVLKFCMNTCFDFEAIYCQLPFSDEALAEDGDTISCSRLFSLSKEQALINCILLRIEVVQYRRQIDNGKDYSWEDFLVELASERVMWDEIICAFRDALGRLDFKPAWLHEVESMSDFE